MQVLAEPLNPGTCPAPPPHWLIRHPYGRDLLACKLRTVRPDVQFSYYCITPKVFPYLEAMIDLLDLRAWPAPVGTREGVAAGWRLLRMIWALKMQRELPTWS
jgi:hypothetical protein